MGDATTPKQLVLFTSSFPFGLGESWKKSEVLAFVADGWDVHVIPFDSSGSVAGHAIDEGVTYHPPLLSTALREVDRKAVLRLATAIAHESLTALAAPSRIRRLKAWASSSVGSLRALTAIMRVELPPAERRLLYFYWGRGAAEALPAIKSELQADGTVVRLHGYDLYEHRSPIGYLPYRRAVWSADELLVVSEAGRRYLRHRAPEVTERVQLRRLGTPAIDRPPRFEKPGSPIRVLSCSSISPVKRVDAIPHLLAAIPGENFVWTHIGDGPLRPTVEEALKGATNVVPSLLGQLEPSTVREILCSRSWDLFINVSSSEGVPVSIMEALAAGIPVVATDVGGTAEIVDNTVGRIIHPELDPASFRAAVLDITRRADRVAIGHRCIQRHAQMSDARVLTHELVTQVFDPLAIERPE